MAVNIQHITDFLLQHKRVSLEKIGTLSLIQPEENEEIVQQRDAAQFVFDKKAETTEELYDFIAQLQQKSLSIVRSDVDSFLEESRQLMNIGSRPMFLQGIGYIYADNTNGYTFSKTSPTGFKESISDAVYDESSFGRVPNYRYGSSRTGNAIKFLLWFIILALLAGIGYFLYSILNKTTPVETTQVMSDSVSLINPEVMETVTPSSSDKYIIESTSDPRRAAVRYAQLKKYGHRVFMDSVDGNNNGKKNYRLYFSFTDINSSDTTKTKDSLQKYFGRKVTIE